MTVTEKIKNFKMTVNKGMMTVISDLCVADICDILHLYCVMCFIFH